MNQIDSPSPLNRVDAQHSSKLRRHCRAPLVWGILALASALALVALLFFRLPLAFWSDSSTPSRVTGGRSRLGFCVSVADPTLIHQSAATALVAKEIERLRRDPAWLRLDPSNSTPLLDSGCPKLPVALGPNVKLMRGTQLTGRVITPRPIVSSAGPYFVMLFVISPEVAADVFRGYSSLHRNETEEILCNSHTGPSPTSKPTDVHCRAVATGLYLTAAEVTDSETLRRALGTTLTIYPP